jgi:hypothetical protein
MQPSEVRAVAPELGVGGALSAALRCCGCGWMVRFATDRGIAALD